MKHRTAACPACAAPVEFQSSSSLVAICDFCQTVVARADKKVEDHGKVADLVLSDSPIRRGATGKFRGKPFDVVGRVQYTHPAGGYWNEWYLSFTNGKWGWLADAQGKLYLTSERSLKSGVEVPPFESLEPSSEVNLTKDLTLTVAEVGEARPVSAEGEIPWDFRPNVEHRYADLHGPAGEFATLDYSRSEVAFYLGREVQLAELEIADEGWAEAPAENRVAALQVNCPQCGGPLELRAPDETQRVGCPSCKSLLSCDQGKLEYLTTLRAKFGKPQVPLGSVGKLGGVEYTVIGVMGRYVKYAGKTYPWTEYLLHNSQVGFRWLVENQKHWSFVEPVSPGAAKELRDKATYNGKRFRLYDRSTAYVKFVLGEFYWKVHAGEQAETADYIAPPEMLSFERASESKAKEVNVSLGRYLQIEELNQAFELERPIRKPWGVGTIQPAPVYPNLYKLWFGFVAFLFLLFFGFQVFASVPPDLCFFFTMLVTVSVIPICVGLHKHSFEVQRWKDSDYSPYATE